MGKHVVIITGTPCVGKTTVARELSARLDATSINLTNFAKINQLVEKEDTKRRTKIINEEEMRKKICERIIAAKTQYVIIDGHYAPMIVPKRLTTYVFVLRRNPMELRAFMEKCGFQGPKLWENLASEILDICLVEAIREHNREKICELDVTGREVGNVANEIIARMNKWKKCPLGCVDWIGLLENREIVDEYLRF